MTSRVCPAQTGPVWKLDGETCSCTLAADHVDRPVGDTVNGIAARDHQCSCGAWFADSARRDVTS